MTHNINKDLWNDVASILESYLAENLDPETPTINYLSGNDLTKAMELSINEDGATSTEIKAEIQKYLKYAARTTHPQFNNQLNAGFNFEALLGELVSFVTNTTMSTYEVSPAATVIENKLIEELNNTIGYTNGDGLMLTGGSNANLMAIHAARNARFPEIKNRGNCHPNLCVYVSKEAHYSHQKAMMLLGLGLDNLILVKAQNDGSMCPKDLELKIKQSISEDKIPLMVCSTAGTTVLGAFDPIEEINKISKTYDLWHHVDGAWGGAVMFSNKRKHLINGLENADSFTFDAHKLLGTGLITSFFLTKEKGKILDANSGGGSQYLFHEYENSEFDSGKKSLQCGRKVDALKLWLSWKAQGHKGLENFVDRQFEKQEYFTNLIKKHPRLQLVKDPVYLNVCFQVIPEDESADINKYNLDLRFKLVRTGKMLTNYSSFEDGTVFFRHVFANNVTQEKDLKHLLDTILEMASDK